MAINVARFDTNAKHVILSSRRGGKKKYFVTDQNAPGSAPPRALIADADGRSTGGNMAVHFTAHGVGGTGDEIHVQVWMGELDGDESDVGQSVNFDLLGTATFVLHDNAIGVAGGYVDDTKNYGQSVTWTAAEYGTYTQLETGKTPRVYVSTADTTRRAEVSIGDFGGRAVIAFVISEMSTGVTGANVLFSLRT